MQRSLIAAILLFIALGTAASAALLDKGDILSSKDHGLLLALSTDERQFVSPPDTNLVDLSSSSSDSSLSQASSANSEVSANDNDFSEMHVKIQSRATNPDLAVNPSWSNATFAAQLCALVTPELGTITIISASISPYFLLPECFYALPASVTAINMNKVILTGNSTFPDPLSRFSHMSLNSFIVTNAIFINPTTSNVFIPSSVPGVSGYLPNWTAFLSAHLDLEVLSITSSNLAGPLLPSLGQRLGFLDLTSNALNGTFPSTFFASVSTLTGTLLDVRLANNRLTGSVPQFPGSTSANNALLSVRLDCSFNSFSGSLPSALFSASNLGALNTVVLNFNQNELSGSLPTAVFDSITSVDSITLDLTSNSFSGSVPDGFLNGVNPSILKTLYLSLASNTLDGSFPMNAILSPLTSSSGMTTLSLSLSKNRFSGAVPSLFSSSSTMTNGFTALNIDASFNKFASTLSATMLSSLPPCASLILNFANCGFYGGIPEGFINGISVSTKFDLDLSNNELVGTPFSNLLNFPSDKSMSDVNINVAGNGGFSGEIFADFCAKCYIKSTGLLKLNFSGNYISGTIPATFLTNVLPNMTTLSIDLSKNFIEGTLPKIMDPLKNGDPISSITLLLDQNNLIGPLPSKFWGGATPSRGLFFLLSLASNKLNGSLTAGFLNDIPRQVSTLALTLDNNPFSGALTESFLAPYTTPSSWSSRQLVLSLANCSLSGLVPSNIFGTTFFATVILDNNRFEGQFPIDTALNAANYSTSATFVVQARNNALSSMLTLPTLTYNTRPSLSLDLDGNQLQQLVVEAGASAYLRRFVISNNPGLTGSLPNSLFVPSSSLTYLSAGVTSLSGQFVDLGSTIPPGLSYLNLSGTAIDFCSGTRTSYSSSAIVTCSLANTNATGCQQNYPSACFLDSPTPPPVATPPPTAPISSPTGCSQSTRPSLDFTCVDGKWTTTVTVTTPTLVIPSGATETIIASDVESSSIVISGLGSTVLISGCANNLTVVTISLTPEQLKSLGSTKTQLLISYTNDTSCNDLSNVEVTLKVTSSSCRTANVKQASSSSSLSGIFTVDSSRCNRWWIILVSVVCALVVVAAIVVALLAVFVPSVRNCLFPYRKRQAQASSL